MISMFATFVTLTSQEKMASMFAVSLTQYAAMTVVHRALKEMIKLNLKTLQQSRKQRQQIK